MAIKGDPKSKSAKDGAAAFEVPVTAEDMPIEVQRLLKSYALNELRWSVPEDRHAIAVEILTRGNAAAERWLWRLISGDDVRSLLRSFGGAGCDDAGRAVLREKMGLTERDVPRRPFRAIPWRGCSLD